MIRFDRVLAISLHSSVPNLVHVYSFEKIHDLLAAMLTQFNNSLNLIRPMSADQIYACAHEMVMTTEEDLLRIEDYVLFFKGALEGRYGKILDRMDQQTIFSMLEEYRQQRYEALKAIKEQQHVEHKALGPSERSSHKNEMEESFYNMAGRLEEVKKKLKEQREINRASRL